MIPEQISNTLIISAGAAVAMVFVLFFMPAIIELKKPKDAGPRMIVDNPGKIKFGMLKIALVDIEEGEKLTYRPTLINATFLYAIQNLES